MTTRFSRQMAKAVLPTPSSDRPVIKSLSRLRTAEAECTRCPLYKDATQVVPGEGVARARLMLVGEQPGDKEDLAGKPFVGPAGRILDRALDDAGIARDDAFVTNAVKHFKHEMRGKRRLHKRPNAHEIERCRWWIDYERAIVKPAVLVAMGATAGRSVFGRNVTINKMRGRRHRTPDGGTAFVTVHPSSLLRMPNEADKERAYRDFVADLKRAKRSLK
ncbi:UdgX family uracil-DNA binding protein [Gaiella sp.]|uniref:UdgX family uracil-DNA binding protein n=1 Tax=Gaiella sp. TaxID=2663207 RepID=UPI002E363615|nr:UdgX family uracil-DNA binding protein [Gaiella sp.]HEX5585601.1 UdgX family uracil-DNA binding protein [Gaiella sp.]